MDKGGERVVCGWVGWGELGAASGHGPRPGPVSVICAAAAPLSTGRPQQAVRDARAAAMAVDKGYITSEGRGRKRCGRGHM